MNTEKKRLEEEINRIRHQRDQLAQQNEADQAKGTVRNLIISLKDSIL